MTPDALTDGLLAARLENRLGPAIQTADTWPDTIRTAVLDTVIQRLPTTDTETQVMLYQVGRALAHAQPLPFANRVLTTGGPDALLAEVCWSTQGWADATSVPLLVALVRSDRTVPVKRQALLILLFTQDAIVPSLIDDQAARIPASPEERELVEFARELQQGLPAR